MKRPDGGEAERKLRLVGHVERAIAEDHAHAGYGVPGKRTLLDHGVVVARRVPAHYNALASAKSGGNYKRL